MKVAITTDEREAILNAEVASYLAASPRTRSVVERTTTTAHMKNDIRHTLLMVSIMVGCLTLGLSLLIDVPLRILLRLSGKKIHDHTTITVLPDGSVRKTHS
ncbi:MAG: hypothetical protein M3R38_08825 [Actinomycetota bacterium]|nr:hypothetical protein [Actinomycetota bacterium]